VIQTGRDFDNPIEVHNYREEDINELVNQLD